MDAIITIVSGILSIIYLIIPFIIIGKLSRIARAIEENNEQRHHEAAKVIESIGSATEILSSGE